MSERLQTPAFASGVPLPLLDTGGGRFTPLLIAGACDVVAGGGFDTAGEPPVAGGTVDTPGAVLVPGTTGAVLVPGATLVPGAILVPGALLIDGFGDEIGPPAPGVRPGFGVPTGGWMRHGLPIPMSWKSLCSSCMSHWNI